MRVFDKDQKHPMPVKKKKSEIEINLCTQLLVVYKIFMQLTSICSEL